MTSVSPEQAIARVRRASRDREPFSVGWCKRKTRAAYDVPSDGTDSAAEAWGQTRRRHSLTLSSPARLHVPRGALVWWTGGTAGDGHVGISAGPGGRVWQVDIRRSGFWDLLHVDEIARRAPRLVLAGWSEDIDGVDVLRTRGRRVDKAERLLERVIDEHAGDKAAWADAVLIELRSWPLS